MERPSFIINLEKMKYIEYLLGNNCFMCVGWEGEGMVWERGWGAFYLSDGDSMRHR